MQREDEELKFSSKGGGFCLGSDLWICCFRTDCKVDREVHLRDFETRVAPREVGGVKQDRARWRGDT